MNKHIVSLLLPAVLLQLAVADVLPQAGFAKRIDFRVTAAAGTSALNDFPVLVRLSESAISGFSYADCAADGSDLRFVDGENNILPSEIDTWDPNGTSLVWVKLPTLTPGEKIVALYGNDDPWTGPSSSSVWSDYVGVYHYSEATEGAVTVTDSSGTQDGAAHANSLVMAGPIGNARGRTDSNGKAGAMMTVPVTDALDTLAPTFTMSTWVRFATTEMNWSYLFGRKGTDSTEAWGCQIGIASGLSPLRLWTNGNWGQPGYYPEFDVSSVMAADRWIKMDAVYDDDKVRLYLDGELLAEKTAVPGVAANGTLPFAIGGPAGGGGTTSKAWFDETRLSVGAKGADWIAAAYANETGAGLLTNSGAEDVDVDAVRFEYPPVFEVTDAGYKVTVTLTSDSHGGAIYAVCGPETPYAFATLMAENGVAGETYSAILTNFPANAMCGIGVKGVSSAATPKETFVAGEGDFLSGAVTVMKTTDAFEENLAVPGVFTVSRPDTPAAKQGDLVVNYTVGGTAVAGTNYELLSGTVTIPDGSASATIDVTPRCCWADTTVDVTLSAGHYEIGNPASATMRIYPRRRAFGFARQVTFEVTDEAGDAGFADFPVLVRFSEESVSGFRYADCAADGSDLRFVDEHAVPLVFEIDTWNPSGTSLVWVKLPALTPGAKIIALYGNANPWPAPSVAALWNDYVGVYHYREGAEGAVTVADSSGTQDGAADSRSIVTAGPIGNARGRTDASGQNGYMMSVAKTDRLDTLAPVFTVSTWVCPVTTEMNWAYLFGRKAGDSSAAWGCQVGIASGFEALRLWTDGTSGQPGNFPLFDPRPELAEGQWVKIDAVYDNEKVRLYLNGELKSEKAAIPGVAANGTSDFAVGGPIGKGQHGTAKAYFDETRLSAGAKSAERIRMEYLNEHGTALLSNSGAADVNTADVQFAGAPQFSWTAEEGYKVSVAMSPYSATASLTALCGPEAPYAFATEMAPEAVAGGVYSVTLTNLPVNAMCGFAVSGKELADSGQMVSADGEDRFLCGAVTVVKTADMRAEKGGAAGSFSVFRPDTSAAKHGDLVVNYTVGGTAVSGVDYEPLSGAVTIPDGSASATITVAPKNAWDSTALVLSVADGFYGIGSPASATMAILAGRKNAAFAKSVDCTASELPEGVVLTNFPVLVRLSESAISGFSYADCAADGSDLRFVDENENALSFEIDTWNPSGASLVWVKLPVLKRGSKVIALYGNDAPWEPLSSASVWSEYAGVYHFSEATAGAVTVTNSVGTGLNDGTAHANSLVTAGPIGNARGRTDATGSNGATMTVAKNDVLDGLVPTFTVSMWVLPTTSSMTWASFFSRQQYDYTPSWGFQCRGNNGALGRFGVYTSGTADNDDNRAIFEAGDRMPANEWTKLDVVYDAMKIRMYLNGELLSEEDAKPDVAKNSTLDFAVGGRPGGGYGTAKAWFDETRLSVGAKGADWIAAAYANETGAGLLTNSGATAPDLGRVRFDGSPIAVHNRGVVTISGRLSYASGNARLTVFYGTDGKYDLSKTIEGEVLPGGEFSVRLDGLRSGRTYSAFVRGESAAHTLTDIEVANSFTPITPPGIVILYR